MQLKYVAVLALVAVMAVAAVNAASPSTGSGSSSSSSSSSAATKYDWSSFKSRKHRFGHRRFNRLHQKFAEFHSDVGEAKAELKVAKAWGKRVCALTGKIMDKKIKRARASLRKWKLVAKLRKAQLSFHKTRHGHHSRHYRYIHSGPKSRRVALKNCSTTQKQCAADWKAKNEAAWERWAEARKEYRHANHHKKLVDHSRVRANAHRRLHHAHKRIRHFNKVIKNLKAKRPKVMKKCHKRVNKSLKKFRNRLHKTRKGRHSTWRQAVDTQTSRNKREGNYAKWVMQSCKPLNGKHYSRQQHVYKCVADLHNPGTGTWKFNRCKRLSEVSTGVFQYKCWK